MGAEDRRHRGRSGDERRHGAARAAARGRDAARDGRDLRRRVRRDRADLLARIREIKERREGGSGAARLRRRHSRSKTDEDSRFQIEASVSGDFHEPADAPHTTIVEQAPPTHGIIGTESGQVERVLDIEPTYTSRRSEGRRFRCRHADRVPNENQRTTRTTRTARTTRTIRTSRTK